MERTGTRWPGPSSTTRSMPSAQGRRRAYALAATGPEYT